MPRRGAVVPHRPAPARARSRLQRRFDDQRGETLVELLMTVVLLGVAIVALVSTMLAVMVATNANRRRVRAANEATTVVETVQNMPYVACTAGTPANYDTAVLTAFVGGSRPEYTTTIEGVRYLQDKTASTATFVASCPGGGDQGLQEITVQLRSSGQTKVTERVVLVKRNQTCPGTPATIPAGTAC